MAETRVVPGERDLKHISDGYRALSDPTHYIPFPRGFWIIERLSVELFAAGGTTAPTTGAGVIVWQYHDSEAWRHHTGTIGATLTTNILTWEPQLTMEGVRDYLCVTLTNGTATDVASVHCWARRVSGMREDVV